MTLGERDQAVEALQDALDVGGGDGTDRERAKDREHVRGKPALVVRGAR
jgi:hypothetical protein